MDRVERLLNIEEAAAALSVSPETLRRMARNGEVPCVKLRSEWRFPSNIAARLLGDAGTVPERFGNVTDESQTLCGNAGELKR